MPTLMQTQLEIPDSLWEVAQLAAARRGCSVESVFVEGLEQQLRKWGDWPKLEDRLRAQQEFLEKWANHRFDPEESRRIMARIDEE